MQTIKSIHITLHRFTIYMIFSGTNLLAITKQLCLTAVSIAMFALTATAAVDVKNGESLFKANCTSCHAVNRQVVGPALKGIEARRDEAWIIKWVKNPSAVIKSGDKYAVELYNKYNQSQMTAFPQFSDDDIRSIVAYVKEEAAKGDAPVAAADGADGAVVADGKAVNDTPTSLTFIGLIILALVLIGVIFVLNKVISTLERLLMAKNGVTALEIAAAEHSSDTMARLKDLTASNKFKFFGTLLVIFSVSVYGWNTLQAVGVEKGYQPKQPIAFSHELHAGKYQINCQYCHSGAYKSKNAGIPSANICMNCHNYVKPESEQIQKIYTALDYNPETKVYGPNQKPIEWVRIHNLPDFAYFPHAQHTKVAGIACQKCHGNVQNMKEVYQYSELTMGWCINCHRETEVNYKDNAYYDKIVAAHEAVKKGEKITAASLGGLECAKCHY